MVDRTEVKDALPKAVIGLCLGCWAMGLILGLVAHAIASPSISIGRTCTRKSCEATYNAYCQESQDEFRWYCVPPPEYRVPPPEGHDWLEVESGGGPQ